VSKRIAVWRIGWLFAVLAVLGCYHDKYNMKPTLREEYTLPPQEKRFNEPEMTPYRKPPPPKEEKTLLGRPPAPMSPAGVGGFGP
jgi:hypothetical protein